MSTREDTLLRVNSRKLIAIVRGLDPSLLHDMAEALIAGGIDLIEVTFAQNNPDSWKETADGIRMLNTEFSGRIMAGAGTVLTMQQLDMAHDAGARYIITPNTDPAIINATRKLNLVSMPGAFTPSEIVTAYNAGADFVKVFPASNLGPSYIKSIKAPLSHIPLFAVGGVNENNTADFIRAGASGVGVGGNLVNKNWMINGEADKITGLAKAFVTAVNTTI